MARPDRIQARHKPLPAGEMTSPNPKSELRAEYRARLKAIPAVRRSQLSAQAAALLATQRVWREAASALFYAPLPDEINLLPLLEQALTGGKAVALPGFVAETKVYAAFQIKVLARDCAPGRFGVLEPRPHCPAYPLNALDIALVPGVAFDAAGRRLGRGGGYYDRLLTQIIGARCGVAFDEQLAPLIPSEPHDIQLNYIVTPTRWLETQGKLPIAP